MRKALESLGCTCAYNDWKDYGQYDVAVFNTSDYEIQRAKKRNPELIIGLSKLEDTSRKARRELARADFLIADSSIQRDYYAFHNANVMKLWLADTVPDNTEPRNLPLCGTDRPICIGYHGNKMHLQQWTSLNWSVLERLAEEFPIRFLAIYNVGGLGKCKLPGSSFPVEHRQWEEDSWLQGLGECDIGIVPNLVPARNRMLQYVLRSMGGLFSVAPLPNDVTIRFKNSANAGRAFPWMHLGIPCVACPVPEAEVVFGDQQKGLTAYGYTAWYRALRSLLTDPKLYLAISTSAHSWSHNEITPNRNAANFLRFLDANFPGYSSIRTP
jgi:hypothetical protein